MLFDFFQGKTKAVIGMVHIPALPGTPLYDARGGMGKLIDSALVRGYSRRAGARNRCKVRSRGIFSLTNHFRTAFSST